MKTFVCHDCSVKKEKDPNITATKCRRCGEDMVLASREKSNPYPSYIELSPEGDQEKSWKGHWWANWWNSWWALPLGLFFLFLYSPIILGSPTAPNGLISAKASTESLLAVVILYAFILSVYGWMLRREQDWGSFERKIPAFIFLLAVSIGVSNYQEATRAVATSPVLHSLAMSEATGVSSCFLWITLLRVGGSIRFGQKEKPSSRKRGSSKKHTSKRKRQFRGYVYVATNPNFSGLVKIGYTKRDVATRMKELSSSTGVPGKYKAAYKFKATHPKRLEKEVHRRLSNHRVRGGEFFRVSPKKAAKVIKKVAKG